MWEELDVLIIGGENFGWLIMEGYYLYWSFFIVDVLLNVMVFNLLFGSGGCEEFYFDFR